MSARRSADGWPGDEQDDRPVGELDDMDRRVLDRLMTAAARRQAVVVANEEMPDKRAWYTWPPLGLDDRGVPFRPGTAQD